MVLQIDPALKKICPTLKIGMIQAVVTVTYHEDTLWREIETFMQSLHMQTSDIPKHPAVAAARACYRKLGKDPTRYRLSSESLFRRLVKQKGLYQVNTVVDLNNLISMRSGHSIGAYDLSNIKGTPVFRIGRAGEPYVGIGRGELNIDGLPVWSDERGPFGSATSDSERTMVTADTTELLMTILAFDGDSEIEGWTQELARLLERFSDGRIVRTEIIE